MRLTISKALFFSGFSFAINFVVATNTYAVQVCQDENILASTPSERFLQEKNGTVTDKKTGLMWQQCIVGLDGNNCDSGDAAEFSWGEALLYPSQKESRGVYAGYNDWRIPNIRELTSIVEAQCSSPSINANIFPNTSLGHVWSSSPYSFYPHYSWYLDFTQGSHTYSDRMDKKSLRLVRDISN